MLTAFTAFWIDPLAVPGRVTIGVFTTLIMANMSFSFRQTLPRVSYIKAIDIWILACTLFVFLALVEYAVVNVILRQKPKSSALFSAGSPQTPCTPISPRKVVEEEGVENIKVFRRKTIQPHPRERDESENELKLEEMAAQIFVLQEHRRHVIYRVLHFLLPETEGSKLSELTGLERCNIIEMFCRFIFPGSFGIFNIIYWFLYLHVFALKEHGSFFTHGIDGDHDEASGDISHHVIDHQ